MKKTFFSVLALVAGLSASAQKWTLDGAHAKLGFTVTHLSISESEGAFKKVTSTITSTKDDFSDAAIDLTAEVNSIDTDNDQRDEHLKGADYFDAAKYPTLTFKSKSFKKVADKKYKLSGDLTLHGVTKPVDLDVTYNGTATHPYTKKTLAGFKITGTIKRKDFGISPGTPDAVLSDEVKILANAEYIKE